MKIPRNVLFTIIYEFTCSVCDKKFQTRLDTRVDWEKPEFGIPEGMKNLIGDLLVCESHDLTGSREVWVIDGISGVWDYAELQSVWKPDERKA